MPVRIMVGRAVTFLFNQLLSIGDASEIADPRLVIARLRAGLPIEGTIEQEAGSGLDSRTRLNADGSNL